MTTATTPAPATVNDPTATLSRLYVARFGVAVVWALLMSLVGSSAGPLTATLLVLYPLLDVAAAVTDARSSRDAGARKHATPVLFANIAISGLAATALVVTLVSSGATVPAVLRVWGVWAVAAGLVQLVVASRRRALGGQWAMIVSGSISVLAGISFVVMSTSVDASLTVLAGYALLGGVFFLISALRLRRAAGRNCLCRPRARTTIGR